MDENANLQQELGETAVVLKDNEAEDVEEVTQELMALIQKINWFVKTQTEPDCKELSLKKYEISNDGASEKDDSTPEKIDTSGAISTKNPVDDATEVDWSVAGPILQKHLFDLENLQSLNAATSCLVKRVKKLTLLKSILNETEKLENSKKAEIAEIAELAEMAELAQMAEIAEKDTSCMDPE